MYLYGLLRVYSWMWVPSYCIKPPAFYLWLQTKYVHLSIINELNVWHFQCLEALQSKESTPSLLFKVLYMSMQRVGGVQIMQVALMNNDEILLKT